MLDGFYVIDSWKSDSDGFSIRLVPDHFEEGQTEPVVTIVVIGLQNPAECEENLQRRKGELIVGLEASESVAAIYAEYDDEPVWLRGVTVSVARDPYALDDIRAFIRAKDEQLNQCHEQLRTYRAALDDTERFIAELIRRAEIKRNLTSGHSGWLDREVDVLQRVLRRVRER
jgi:hypothetical protein